MKTAVALSPSAELIDALIAAAIEAGGIVMAKRKGALAVERKADDTPVTEADRAAEAAILKHLIAAAPELPIVAEESCSSGKIPDVAASFFLVDALDGTKEYVRGGTDFTVNIGLITDRVPVVGVVFAPADGALYTGVAGKGAWAARVVDGRVTGRRPIRVRLAPQGPIDVVASRSHRTPETDACIGRYQVGHLVAAGSSLKFCLVAAGEADLYPRMGPTMQWDTAAGDAILRAAGGKVVTLDGAPLIYGPKGTKGMEAYGNPWFIAVGGIEPICG